MHVTSGSFSQAMTWLPRHSGSACTLRFVVRFLVGHAGSGDAAGVTGRGVAVARRAARTPARGGLRVCGASGGWQWRREEEREAREGLPGDVLHLRQGGQTLQDGELLGS